MPAVGGSPQASASLPDLAGRDQRRTVGAECHDRDSPAQLDLGSDPLTGVNQPRLKPGRLAPPSRRPEPMTVSAETYESSSAPLPRSILSRKPAYRSPSPRAGPLDRLRSRPSPRPG